MFGLFKKQNIKYNYIINIKSVDNSKCINGNLILCGGCRNDSCTEPTKERIGWGSYAGLTAKERIIQGKCNLKKGACMK